MSSSPTPRAQLRPEIQALRAVAVAAVLLFHLWPNRLTGGYVGVDVFFAISGFLITAHLLREVDATGRIRFAAFWARRARRLLPASLLVLAVSAGGTYLFVPQEKWQQFFSEIGASALYVQNWLLAHNAVDYLASENAPSVAQHFWTLSAEEQYYAVWPLLIAVVLLLARRRSTRVRRNSLLAVLVLLTAASLAYSVWETSTNPSVAYFITPTRIWEFGLGAIVAFVWPEPAGGVRLRVLMSWVGLGCIAVATIVFTADTVFPGYAAALPVVGALLVIVAGPVAHPAGTLWLARLRPVQFLGDVSYSVYLWHWPLIVLAPYVL
ncbi:MAG: acyltransferase family protein, partial [Streptosporangiaceae bacterium]